MYTRIIKNDIRNTKIITMATILFVTAAALFVSLAGILLISLIGATDTLMTKAQTPHIIQMHAGELDRARLEQFVRQNPKIAEAQVLEFLNIDNAEIVFEKGSLADSVEDNGFVTQSELFDFLLDLEGNIITVQDGEVYVPIVYWKKGLVGVGDRLTVYGREFTVAGLVRDSQMNSSLAGSKRLLVSADDYAELRPSGRVEYLIELRVNEMADIGRVEAEYISAGLEANGPMVNYRLFSLSNGLSDGIVVGIILLLAVLVTGIAFLCIRFTLLAKIEDEYREIGTMKAIGMRVGDLKKIYLAKYAFLSAGGCIAGFVLSLFFRETITENIRLYMGEGSWASLAPVLTVCGVLPVFTVMLLYVNRVLKSFRKISAAEALRFGMVQDKRGRSSGLRLSNSRYVGTNIFLGLKDVWNRKSMYATMFFMLIICSFAILVPQNLSDTIADEEFMSYIGMGRGQDLIFSVNQMEGKEKKTAEITTALAQNPAIAAYTVLTTKMYSVLTADGTRVQMKVELGDHNLFPVSFYQGRLPVSDQEIAISGVNADELVKKVGDSIILITGAEQRVLTICGIYSEVQNGGKTAKATFTDHESATWYTSIAVKLKNGMAVDRLVSAYSAQFPEVKVYSAREGRQQTMGTTIQAIKLVARGSLAVALGLTFLIVVLFMRMLIAKDRYAIAVLRAAGFTGQDIVVQYLARFMVILLVSLILGTVLANLLGEPLALMSTSSLGVRYFRFIINPLSSYLLTPLLMAAAVLAAIALGARSIRAVDIMENLRD